jgi:hypothetical protein
LKVNLNAEMEIQFWTLWPVAVVQLRKNSVISHNRLIKPHNRGPEEYQHYTNLTQ